MKTLKQESIQVIKVIVLAVVLSLGLGIVQAWVGPTVAPTEGNVDAPINVGVELQIKNGPLWAGGLLSSAGGYFYDKVGVGVVSPTEKLEVDGNAVVTGNITVSDVYITSSGKWVSEIFPTYLVNNQHTTSQCSTIGTVVEYSGVKFCRIAGSSCGSWTQYGSWNTTPAKTCSIIAGDCNNPCTTGSHSFSNNAASYSCTYNWGYWFGSCDVQASYTCYSVKSEVGCY